jgi:hypothetical protein
MIAPNAGLDVYEQQRLSEIDHRERTEFTYGPTHDDFAFLLDVIKRLDKRVIEIATEISW